MEIESRELFAIIGEKEVELIMLRRNLSATVQELAETKQLVQSLTEKKAPKRATG